MNGFAWYLAASVGGVVAGWAAHRTCERQAGLSSLLCCSLVPFSHMLAVGALHDALYEWLDVRLRVLEFPWHQALAFVVMSGLSWVYVLVASCLSFMLADRFAGVCAVDQGRVQPRGRADEPGCRWPRK